MKKLLKYTLLALLVVFLLRSWLFEKTVTYQPLTTQPTYPATDPALLAFLASQKPTDDIESTIRQAIDLTGSRLRFRATDTATDPNRAFRHRRAHCVGYAAFFHTACNFLLAQNGLSDQWEATAVRGRLSWLGIDLHQFSDHSFFQDHDFNVVVNRRTNEQFLVDASVRDGLGIYYLKKK